MKNNQSKRNENVKGFYIALGISALMIGSACYFSYKEGDSKYEEISSEIESSQYAVDKKETNIPKITTTERKNSYVIVSTTTVTVTETSAVITETEIQETNLVETDEVEITAETETETEPQIELQDENIHQPLRNTINIINEFSGKELVKNITTGSWQTHNGTDYGATIGDDVFAISDGSIIDVNNDPLWGTTVVIQNPSGVTVRYCNLAKDLSVQRGIAVSAGDIIGSIGDTADIESSLEPHLHLEVIKNGEYLNPADFIN